MTGKPILRVLFCCMGSIPEPRFCAENTNISTILPLFFHYPVIETRTHSPRES